MFRRADRLFRRYQQTGEPRLLGMVFDRTAGELLRVALHVTRDRHRAEDLLQSTFLTAIEKAGQYDAARPLVPWLLEILVNHARQVHRRERRALPAPARASESGDVGDEAAARELAATCDRALDALGEPYRQVLILHLRHALSGQEIAAVLSRPDSTVRNQIARGLDLLRRKLPASLTAAFAVATVSGRGLAAVRCAVLAKVPVPAGVHAALAATAGASFFGVLLMGNKVVVSFVLLALVAGGVVYSGLLADPAAAVSPSEGTRVASTSTAAQPAGTEVPAPLPVDREAATTSGGATTGSLRATVVAAADGSPVANAPCAVWQRTEDAPRRLVAQDGTRADGTVLFTLAPGTFELEIDSCDHLQDFTITAGAETRLQCKVLGFRLEGIVVDPDGRPVGGAEVRRERKWSSVLLARTAPDGTFAAHVRSGQVWAVGAGRQPAKRQGVVLRRDTAGVRLVLGGAGTRLSGRVVDERGEGAAQARVFIGLDTKRGSPTFSVILHDLLADEAGNFALDWLPPGRVCVAAVPTDQDVERATMRELVVEEAVPVQLQLRLGDGATVAGIVRDEHGAPIPGAGLHATLRSIGIEPLEPLAWRWMSAGPDGRFEIRGLFPGRHVLQAVRGGMSVDTKVELQRGKTLEWNPVLANGAPIAVRVLGPDDEPLRHHYVVVEVGGRPTENGATDLEGRLRLPNNPPVEHVLKVCAANTGVILAQRTIMPGPDEVLIRIEAGKLPSARISGRIVDARGAPVLDSEVSLRANSGFSPPLRVDRDGRFRTGLLPPGTYSLSATGRAVGLGWAHASAVLAAKEDRDVGDIVLPATASLAIRLRGADGSKVRDALLRLGNPRETWSGTDFLAADEVDGVYRKTGINPGQHVLCLLGPDVAPQSVLLTLLAGERRELEVVAERGAEVAFEVRCCLAPKQDNGLINCQMSVTDVRGERVVTHRLFGYFDDHPQRIKRVRLGLLPGTYRVHIEEAGGKTKELEITVPAVAPRDPFVLDLR